MSSQQRDEITLFVKEEFIGLLMKKVQVQIQEKKALAVKRANWNLKRQDEKIESAQKRRTEWQYEETANSIPLKKRLD
jgi:hypothetical protein